MRYYCLRGALQGIIAEKMNQDEDEKSVLQNKLDDMTNLITKGGMLAGACIALTFC